MIRRLTPEDPPGVEAALFVQKGDIGAHVGVLHNSDEGPCLLHQAWHCVTLNQRLDRALAAGEKLWLALSTLSEDEQNDLRAHAALVVNQLRTGLQIPYAFRARDAAFDTQGKPGLGQSLGLSCSTFITRLFAAARVPLLVEESWQLEAMTPERIAEDKAKQQELVQALKESENPTRQRQGAALQAEVGSPRIRAEEVAAASGLDARPADFAAVEPVGRRLLVQLLQQVAEPAQPAATAGQGDKPAG